jgi:asparagine synthase (glutamine-hydrolysing)
MGFEDPRVDEAPFARVLAEHLGGQHTEFRLGEEDVLKVWDSLWSVYDEPFADSSALPMVALCRLVAPHVKVGLSGDGGDETFCGYPWHRALNRLNGLSAIPAFLRRPLAVMTAALAPSLRYKASAFGQADRVGQWSALRTGLSDGASRLLPVQGADARAPFREYFCEWSRGLESVTDPLDWACRMDLLTYLPDDLMVKADRASMNVGLELREPLLDHQLTEWCLRLPIEFRFDRATDTTKILPRELLQRRLPKALYEKPKRGFTPPLDRWLNGPLRPAACDALDRIRRGDLAPLHLPSEFKDWSDCASRLNDQHQQFLWRIVCFSEWMRHHASDIVTSARL